MYIIPFIIQTTKFFLCVLHFPRFLWYFKRSKLCCNCFHHPSTDDCKNTVKVKTNFYFTEFFLCKNVLHCTASASTYPNMPMLLMIVLLGKEVIGFCSGICLCINLVSEKNTISPAYDPNSKNTWNSHVFCVGTHWKSENVHQCSSPKHHKPWPKHHRSITTRHWDTKASPTQSRDITNTKPRHHPHITKTSQHNHYTSPRHAQDITNTSLKDHQNITSTCRKHLDTPPKNHWNISEISPNHPWNTNKT